MSRLGFLRSRRGLAVVTVVVLLGAVALVWGLGGDDDADAPNIASSPSTSAAPTEEPTETPTPTATPTPTSAPTTTSSNGSPTCEGPDTQFNVEGVQKNSLLPDCGAPPALGCGGSYPVILFKTSTGASKSSICGVDSSGAKVRVVVAPDGGRARELKGSYDYQLDSFVAKDGDTSYVIQAYDGTILTVRGGQTVSTEKSVDWISLDNESDGEAE